MESKNFKNEKIRLKFSLENCEENAMYQITFRLLDDDDSEEPFKTREITNKEKHGSIKFKKVFMCNYDFSQICPIKINLEKWHGCQYENVSIKEKFHLSLSTIVASKDSTLKTKTRDFKDDSEIIIIEADNPEYSCLDNNSKYFNFFDYLKAGIHFESYIIIDFTEGQEHISNLRNNQFIQVIEGFRETLYEYDKCFKVLGYGAKLKNDENNNDINSQHFFNLGMEEKAENSGFTMIVKKYRECLEKLKFDKRGYLSPVFDKIRKDTLMAYSPEIYNIVFILLHNKPSDDDIQKCIDLQIETAYLPISYVIILIGNKTDDEIKEIKHIFSNKKKFSSQSIERTRNNLSFFTMKKYNYNVEILKNNCLREIPEQIIDFYKKNNTSPEDIRIKNLDNIRKSYRVFDPNNSLYEDAFSAPTIAENPINNERKDKIQIKQNENNINQINKEENINKIIDNSEKIYYNKPMHIPEKNVIDIKRENPFRKKNKENIINIEKEKKEKQNNIEIKKENSFNKKDYVNETPDPDKIKEKEIEVNKNIPNPFKKDGYVNETPNPDKEKEIEVKENKYILNPFRNHKNEIKINLNHNNVNKINVEENYSNEGIKEKEKKYNNILNNKNQNKNDNDKIYKNATSNPDDEPKQKYIPNPFVQKKIISDNKNNDEKKYVNVTPGQENNIINHNVYISNPFKNNNEKNEIKLEEDKKEKNEIKIKEDKKENEIKIEKNDEKKLKKSKIGLHFKKKFDIDISKLSTLSNSRPENYDYSND